MLATKLTTYFSGEGGIFLTFPLVVAFLYILLCVQDPPSSKFPSINGRKGNEILYTNSRRRFLFQASVLIKSGFQKYKNAFKIFTDIGPILILSPKYAHEIRNDDRLSLQKFTSREFHSHIAGFEPFNVGTLEAELMFNSIKQPLQQALEYLVQPLSDETINALSTNWTDNPAFHEIVLKPSILQIVAQLSSKVFTGDDLCRNSEWHKILITYTVNVYEATQALIPWPKFLRPLVARFSLSCKTLRAQMQEAERILLPVLSQRQAEKEVHRKERNVPTRIPDAIDWMQESAGNRSFNPTIAQLLLSFAAIHSTADMMTQAIYDICGQEELLNDMRKEIISVLQEHGWTRAALYNLKLMDSVLKESQRLKPTRMISMGRIAEETVQLQDGTTIPKGTSIMVSSHSMWDENEYSEPHRFDGYRFLKLRQRPGHENDYQLVSAAPNHMGFGYGKHVCPGRFFAANEVKIALCHMLLKYDFKLVEGDLTQVVSLGFNLFTKPTGKIAIRRRKEEIPL